MTQETVVVAFARLPVPGKAKTRLAAGVGPTAAAEFYKLCAECTFHEIAGCPHTDAVIYCSGPDDVPGMHQWLQQTGLTMSVCSQQQVPDLGQRMIAALTAAATEWDAQQQRQQQQQMLKELQGVHSNGHQQQQQQQQRLEPRQQETSACTAAADQPQTVHLQQQNQKQQQQQQQMQKQQIMDHRHQVVADLTAAPIVPNGFHARQRHQQQPTAQQDGLHAVQHHHHQQQQEVPYSAAIVVGTDIPDLSSAVIATAAAALQQYDLVLGPAVDGGFYLMGLSTAALLRPEVQSCQIFEGVEWSTKTVLQRTMQGAAAAGLRIAPYHMLPVLQDIDEMEDLKAWVEACSTKQQVQQQQQQQQHAREPMQQVQQQLFLQACPRGRLLQYCQSLLSD